VPHVSGISTLTYASNTFPRGQPSAQRITPLAAGVRYLAVLGSGRAPAAFPVKSGRDAPQFFVFAGREATAQCAAIRINPIIIEPTRLVQEFPLQSHEPKRLPWVRPIIWTMRRSMDWGCVG